jgi:putative membrane protein
MKNIRLGNGIGSATFMVTATLLMSCSHNQQTSTSPSGSDSTTTVASNTAAVSNASSTTTNNSDTSMDNQFMRKAAEINLEEIRVGRLAATKGVAADIRNMGKMLENDHSKSLNQLTTLSMKKNVTIPQELDVDAQNDYRKLDDRNGREFDKKFSDMMVDGHKEAISLFEKEASKTNDPDIRNYANQTLPVLHKHLDEAMKCQESANRSRT